MGESKEKLIYAIKHYQDSLERHTKSGNVEKILHAIEKLSRLPIKVCHLEETGVGRTVNGLKKFEGPVGDNARTLVDKWKTMVKGEEEEEKARLEQEEKMQEDEVEEEENDTSYEDPDPESLQIVEPDEDITEENLKVISSSHKKSSSSNKHTHSNSKHSNHDKKLKRHHSSSDSESSGSDRKSKKHRASKSRKDDSDSDSDSSIESSPRRTKSKHKSRKSSSESSDRSSSNDSDSSSDRDTSRKHKSKNHNDHDSKERDKHRHRHSNKDRLKDSTKSKHDKKNKEKESSLKKDSSSSSKSESKHEKEKSGKRSSSSKIEETKKENSRTHKDRENGKNSEDKKRHSLEKEAKRQKKEPSENKDSSSSKSRDKDKKKGDDSRKDKDKKDNSRKSSEKSSKDKPKASSSKIINFDSIDSGSGTSFAAALGMLGAPISSKIKKKAESHASKGNSTGSSSKSTSNETSSKNSSNGSKNRNSEGKNSKNIEDEDLLTNQANLEPLPQDIDVSNLLPSITPHYKPLGVSLDGFRKNWTDEEALSTVISAKKQRTKVYSGNKSSYTKVPTLFDLCSRVLQDNIDALEYTGGVPYSILKPILEKANPDQLYQLEFHNPYLIEDTDELWQLHCQKEFRNKKREELESWREMYLRCLDEREAKLKALTANIKQSQDKSLPVRQTKLAYVDSVVKPPRNIARKQARNGTVLDFQRPAQTTQERLSQISKAGEAGKVVVSKPGRPVSDRPSSSSNLKPKKAPLMAKTLSLLKNRFGRR